MFLVPIKSKRHVHLVLSPVGFRLGQKWLQNLKRISNDVEEYFHTVKVGSGPD